MMMTPKTKFEIGQKIVTPAKDVVYIIDDIVWSALTDKWYYNYSYYEGGYQHHCSGWIEVVEQHFEAL